MVLLEESGIAKGVRRIVAVTGKAAHEGRQNAVRLEERMARLGQMTTMSPEKETLVRHVQAELATTAVSILDRRALSRRLEEITKEMLKEQKASLKVQVNAAITLVETAIEQDPSSTSLLSSSRAPTVPPRSSRRLLSRFLLAITTSPRISSGWMGPPAELPTGALFPRATRRMAWWPTNGQRMLRRLWEERPVERGLPVWGPERRQPKLRMG